MTTKKKTTVKRTPKKPEADPQLDWDGAPNSGDERPALSPREIRELPPVEESVNAQDLAPRCVCTLTPGCNGIVTTYSTHRRIRKDENGKPAERITEQYVKCNKCGRAPVNPRRISQALNSGSLFDRRKAGERGT